MNIREIGTCLVAVSVVLSTLLATGAFDSATTHRSASVEVVGDGAGYLGLQPSSGPNGNYARIENGKLSVDFSRPLSEGGGSGVNADATIVAENVFTITNQGGHPVAVWITDSNERITLTSDEKSIETRSNRQTLAPGKTLAVGVTIDTTDTSRKSIASSFTLHSSTDDVSSGASSGGSRTAGPDDSDPVESDEQRKTTAQTTNNDGRNSTGRSLESYGLTTTNQDSGRPDCTRTRSTYVPGQFADCGSGGTLDPETVIKKGAAPMALTAATPVPGDEMVVGAAVTTVFVVAVIADAVTQDQQPEDGMVIRNPQAPGHSAPLPVGDSHINKEGPKVRAPSGNNYNGPEIKAPGKNQNQAENPPPLGENREDGPTIETIKDPTGEKVEIKKDHANREDDDHATYQEAVETIAEPDEIWEKGPHRTYVKEIDGEWVTVRGYDLGDKYNAGTSVIYEHYNKQNSVRHGDPVVSVEGYLIKKNFDLNNDKVEY